MLTTFGELEPTQNESWIVYPGQLVAVRQNCFEHFGSIGIIIDCANPHFGIGYEDEYWVFLDGKICRIKTFMIYPVNSN